jgi:hypothetical protein
MEDITVSADTCCTFMVSCDGTGRRWMRTWETFPGEIFLGLDRFIFAKPREPLQSHVE